MFVFVRQMKQSNDVTAHYATPLRMEQLIWHKETTFVNEKLIKCFWIDFYCLEMMCCSASHGWTLNVILWVGGSASASAVAIATFAFDMGGEHSRIETLLRTCLRLYLWSVFWEQMQP